MGACCSHPMSLQSFVVLINRHVSTTEYWLVRRWEKGYSNYNFDGGTTICPFSSLPNHFAMIGLKYHVMCIPWIRIGGIGWSSQKIALCSFFGYSGVIHVIYSLFMVDVWCPDCFFVLCVRNAGWKYRGEILPFTQVFWTGINKAVLSKRRIIIRWHVDWNQLILTIMPEDVTVFQAKISWRPSRVFARRESIYKWSLLNTLQLAVGMKAGNPEGW